MTDDLVKRLRRADTCIFPTERDRCHCGEAADRIEKLEAALLAVKLTSVDIVAVAIAVEALEEGNV